MGFAIEVVVTTGWGAAVGNANFVPAEAQKEEKSASASVTSVVERKPMRAAGRTCGYERAIH